MAKVIFDVKIIGDLTLQSFYDPEDTFVVLLR